MKKELLLSTFFLLTLPLLKSVGGEAHAQGSFAWAKQMGGTNWDQVLSIKTDAAGNVYTMGSFQGTVDLDPGVGVFNLTPYGGVWDNDIYISKLDASGNFVWAKQLGGVNWDQPGSMTVDAAGNVYTTGSFEGTSDLDPGTGTYNLTTIGEFDEGIFVSKLDANGNFVWAKQFSEIEAGHFSEGVGIAIDLAGDVYTTGGFQGTTDFDPGAGVVTLTPGGETWSQDVFISKLDAAGNFLWVKQINGQNFETETGVSIDKSGNIAVDNSGNVFTTGDFLGTTDFDPDAGVTTLTAAGELWNQNIYVLKLDASGNFVWARRIGGESFSYPNDIAVDAMGNVYTTGNYEGVTDFNPGAGVYNLTPEGSMWNQDIFVSKLDATGNFGWARSMGGAGFDGGSAIAVDIASNVYTIGFFSDSADFNPRAGVYNLSTASMWGQDIFVSKLNDAGSFVWAKHIGGTGDFVSDQGTSITTDATANTYFTGMFQGTTDMDPGIGEYDFTAFGGIWDQDVFVEKLRDTLSTVGIQEYAENGMNEFSLYPNPSTGIFNVAVNLEADSKLTIELVDITGQQLKAINQSKLNAGVSTITIDGSALPDGIYFVRIYNETINKTLKILINK